MSTIRDDRDPVNFSDIRWTLDPPELLEAVDLLTLNDEELLDYARELQRDHLWLRRLCHETLAMLHRATIQLDRFRVRVDLLITELRAVRQRRPEADRQ